jgi:hypothetical protein
MSENIFCQNHLNKFAKKICNECNVAVCNGCVLDFHMDHFQKVSKLKDAFAKNKEVFVNIINETSRLSHPVSKKVVNECLVNRFHEGTVN